VITKVDPIPAIQLSTNKPVVIVAFDPTDALVVTESGEFEYVIRTDLKADAYWWSHVWDTDPAFEAKLAQLEKDENPLASGEEH